MKKTITRNDLQTLQGIFNFYLQQVEKMKDKPKVPFELSYGLSRNESRIEEEIKAIKEGSKCLDDADFKKRNLEIVGLYCVKDANNQPILKDGFYQFTPANANLYNELCNKLKEEYPEIKAFDTFLTQEVEIDFYPIKLSQSILSMDMFPSWVKLLTKYLIVDED